MEDKGWIDAQDLIPGDRFLSHDGQWIAIEEIFDTGEWETVYNLRIADHHTYFVGCDEWGFSVWAHNTACGPEARRIFRESTLRRHAFWADDIGSIDSTIIKLMERALKTAQREGRGWQRAEALLEKYLVAVSNRLQKMESRFGVEWQAAGLRQNGARTIAYQVNKYTGQRFPTLGSKRLDVVITFIPIGQRGVYRPLVANSPANRVLRGYDIAMDPKKLFSTAEYQEAFRSMTRLTDMQIMPDGSINIIIHRWIRPGPGMLGTVTRTIIVP